MATPIPAITGAGRLSGIDGPLTNDTIGFTYDEWSRTTGSGIGGVMSSASLDAIGRVTQVANPLGLFQYGYVGLTGDEVGASMDWSQYMGIPVMSKYDVREGFSC